MNISSLAKDPDYVAQLTTEVGAIYDDNTGNMALKLYLLLKVVGFFYFILTNNWHRDIAVMYLQNDDIQIIPSVDENYQGIYFDSEILYIPIMIQQVPIV